MRAGLAMQAAMEEINEQIAADVGAELHAPGGDQLGRGAGRAGRRRLHGDRRPGQRRRAAPGAPPSPGTVTVGEITHRLTRAAIEYDELEPLELKGKAEPVPAWEAVSAVVRGPRRAQPARRRR